MHRARFRVACRLMSDRPTLGIVIDDPRSLTRARGKDPVDFVALRSSLANMPRASGARSLAESARMAHPDAQLALYGWHYLTHTKADGLAARAARKLKSKEFGHLRDCDGVQQAWEVTHTALEAAAATWLVLRTPPSFSTGAVSRKRLADFASARRAEGYRILWAPEGLWTDVEALAVGADCGVEVLLSVRFDRIDASELAGAWLRIDGELRPSAADQLAFAVDDFEDRPPVLFSGPRAYPNLRNYARASGDLDG